MSRTPTRVTLDDVAQRAGVSPATVSRVINDSARVSAAKAARVHAAIRELDYVPHTTAQMLAADRTQTLGLLLPAVSGSFFESILSGIQEGVAESGYDLLIHAADRPPGDEERLRRPLGEHNTDGLIAFPDTLSEGELRRLHRRNFPVVLLHHSTPAGVSFPVVTFENKSGARKAVDHLIEVHGKRRILYLTGPVEHEDSYWRERGYRESLAAHDIPFDPALIAVGDFEQEQAERAVTTLLREGATFDAIFAGDDESAIGVMKALRQAGRRIPDDVSLVGFDDVYVSRHLSPPLTTVHAPITLAGLEAVRQLVRLMASGDAEPITLLPTRLVVRQSCGCPS